MFSRLDLVVKAVWRQFQPVWPAQGARIDEKALEERLILKRLQQGARACQQRRCIPLTDKAIGKSQLDSASPPSQPREGP